MKKTIDGITKLLKGLFGKKNKKFSEKLQELPEERQEAIHRRAQELIENEAQKPSDGLQHVSLEGLIEIASHEGLCLSKYKDSVGVYTIGIGITRTEIPDLAKWPADKTITIEEAFAMMQKAMGRYEKAIRRALKVEVPQHAFDALVSWAYNVGGGWAKKATVIKLINRGVPLSDKRVYNALMMYKKPKEIIGRRRKEAKLLCYGEYSNDGTVNVFPVSKNLNPIYRKGKKINVRDYLKGE